LFLIMFLVVHCYVNAMIFWPDEPGGETGKRFTEAASFMGGNVAIRIMEIGLFAGLIVHMVQGLLLWRNNAKRRPVRYEVSAGSTTSSWYSRSMGLLGTLILLFLILHLYHFWAPNRYGQAFDHNWKEEDLYHKMIAVFSEMWVVVVYVLGCISLAWHLMHGFFSAFQTFGLTTHRYKGIVKSVGVAFSILIPLIFAIMPIYLHIIGNSSH